MFSYAYEYSEPDVVIYLGDLMDEGSKATPMEYEQTLDRIHSVFKPAQYVKVGQCKGIPNEYAHKLHITHCL